LAVKDVKAGETKHIMQDTDVFSERDSVQLRMDLTESQIYICSPEVLMLFSDNFDFQVRAGTI
jgi:translation initiation factor eIF-2B subunit epsilon